MENTNQAEDYRRLQELYADMSDSRLEEMAGQMDDLTQTAQGVLRAEMAKRGMDSPTEDSREMARRALQNELSNSRADAPFHPAEGPSDGLPEDPRDPNERGPAVPGLDPTGFDLVPIWNVNDPERAQQVMNILSSAGIKSYLGPDNVEEVNDFKGSYEEGVDIKVMKFQGRFAVDGLRRIVPPEPEDEIAGPAETACPRCHTPDIVFQGIERAAEKGSAEKYIWSCDACGHRWEDDGIEERR